MQENRGLAQWLDLKSACHDLLFAGLRTRRCALIDWFASSAVPGKLNAPRWPNLSDLDDNFSTKPGRIPANPVQDFWRRVMDMTTMTEDPIFALNKIEQNHKVVREILNDMGRSFHLNDNETAKSLILKLQMKEVSHFYDEEEIMERFHYPDLKAHTAQHDQIIDTLSNINRVFIEKNPRSLSIDLIDYLEKFQSHEEEWDVPLINFLSSIGRG